MAEILFIDASRYGVLEAGVGFEPTFMRLMRPGWDRTPVTPQCSLWDSNPCIS